MLISKKIIEKYIDIADLTIEDLADKVTKAGFEVEDIIKVAQGTNLTIGHVESCVDHEDSDHLHVCQVNIGEEEPLQIVCGAPNVCSGMNVIVAKVGAKLPGGDIKAGVIRGVESNGMLCSLNELGVDSKMLSEKQLSGIEELNADAPIGCDDVLGYLGLDDAILDIGLTPNRNDCMANFAFIEELGAILDRPVNLPTLVDSFENGENSDVQVNIACEECSYYSAKVVKNVCVKESSEWIKQYLLANNIAPKNNLVDISNVVMLATGQPLHFYDYDKLNDKTITIARGDNQQYEALDENTYELSSDDIVIKAGNDVIAIAGVIGGNDTKVDENTKNILIEVASFDHVSIRNTARHLNLNTDASVRFQKGIQPQAPIDAMNYAVMLLQEDMEDVELAKTVVSGSRNNSSRPLRVSLDNINQRLGTTFSYDSMVDVLRRLKLQPSVNGDLVDLVIPPYRQDLEIEADISEEIIRILGYDDLQSTLPTLKPTLGQLNKRQQLRRKLQSILTHLGLNEALTYSLVSESVNGDAIMPLANNEVVLASPMSEDRKMMRTSILPSLLSSISYNQKRSMKDVALFEISNVYRFEQMQERLALVISGNLHETRWMGEVQKADFYLVKGILTMLLEELGFASNRIAFKENKDATTQFHPYQSSEVYIGKDLLGVIGKIHPSMAKKYDVSKDCVMMEINLDLILNSKVGKIKFKSISKYPSVKRDLAFMVKQDVQVNDLMAVISKNSNRLISNVEIFDIYQGEHVQEGYKSVALSLTFQSETKTLTDEEINEVNEKIKAALNKQFDAQLRE